MSFYFRKNVVVTGASSGIGRALCLRLVQDGAQVFAVASREKKLKELSEGYKGGGRIIPIVLDITEIKDFQRAIKEINKYSNNIDIIINNAGVGHYGSFMDSTFADEEQIIATNFIGAINFLRIIYLNFMKQGEENYIIFTTSLAGKIGFEKLAVYSATKFALEGFAESLRKELSSARTTVTVFRPGVVGTNFFRTAGMLSYEAKAKRNGWLRSPEEVASYLLEKIPTRKKAITVGGDRLFLKILPFISEKYTLFILGIINKLIK